MQESAQISDNKKNDVIVRTSNIWKSFNTGDHYSTILKDVSTDIKAGEFVILFGPSGCGKSTFLNTLIGLEHPDKGDVVFMGIKLWTLNSDDRALIRKKNIGIVYQQQNWLKSLNVLDNVALIGSLLGYSKEEADKLAKEKLELVGMTRRSEYKPYELSSGEQQRISLARSLVSDPSLIVADEPTGNLDVKSGLKVMQIFKDLARSGKTIVMVTHNIESLEFADRILFMLDGRIRKDIYVKKDNITEMKERITEDLELFIDESKSGLESDAKDAPAPRLYIESLLGKKARFMQIMDFIKFNIVFTFSMFLLLFLYVPAYILEHLFFKKKNLAYRAKTLVTQIFNKLEGEKKGVERSISSWDLGTISLRHLMEKKSRTLITVIGVGIGIGFITFLLSLGYGLERLVIGEMAKIEEKRQVQISPIVSSEIILDKERLDLVSSISGIKEIYPLINVATTVFYGDSQTDIVAYGVDSNYLNVTQSVFLAGTNFENSKHEVVISEDVLAILALKDNQIIGQNLILEFIPVGQEETVIDDNTQIVDNRVEYLVTGIIAETSSPVLYFSNDNAKSLGIENASEALLVLEPDANMSEVRRQVETLGMETSSVMDTVSQVEVLFGYFRIGLAVIGTVAFLIAVLGMINTLTVSLLERTREVGLLKSIGMRSAEVRKLFVTESMLIAFSGGVIGVSLGFIGGAILSGVFSAISISRGGEYVIVSQIPILLTLSVVFISVLVGFLTGLYPSKRAVRMSPLDALRYE